MPRKLVPIWSFLAILTFAGLVFGQDRQSSNVNGGGYFPRADSGWLKIEKNTTRVDLAKLDDAVKFAGQHNSQAVVILWRGKILAERYWQGWNTRSTGPLYSATKSFVGTLVGMAVEDGKIRSVEQSCSDFLPEWKGLPQYEKIQIRHLLSMTSGLRGNKRIFLQGLFANDERAFATALPIDHAPGEHWEYHNSAYRLLFQILEAATDQSLAQYSAEKLFRPLQMHHPKWSRKRRNPQQYTFLTMSARDAARFGLMILRQGNWNGKQLVSKNWIEESTKPWNEKVNPSYGRLWWLNAGDFHYLPANPARTDGSIFPKCPEDAFAALGKDDKKIYVAPSLDLVVVRLGGSANSAAPAVSGFDGAFFGKICESFKR
jgi:CubicO group peptidase (beta-lactamase class C family)